MIKFVCATCGERLSVPDRLAGRQSACPSCNAVNHIPLKGFPTSQPAPTPRPAGASRPLVAPPAPRTVEPMRPALRPARRAAAREGSGRRKMFLLIVSATAFAGLIWLFFYLICRLLLPLLS